MRIIGKLIKRTTAITYKRNLKKKKDLVSQSTTLSNLMEKAKRTALGNHYNFQSILTSQNSVAEFQAKVPIVDYDAFYDAWLKDCMEGKKDWIWPGTIQHYALSSGTTGSPSKRIPVTNQMIRSFQKTSIAQITSLHELDLSEDFYNAHFLVVGGSSQLVNKGNYIEGDLSGILKKYTSFIATPFTKPPKKIAEIRNWNQKLEAMVDKAPEWNIGIVAGVPSWCILLMEKIVERYQLKSIHEIWPNFEVYVHGGVFMDPYLPRLKKVLGKEVHTLDTYLASEGYFAYQKINSTSGGMQLILNGGVFFEFVPFNSDYFDSTGELLNPHTAFSIDEVQPNLDYAIVISTNAGLWRYMIGDLVRFTDVENREIKITGRIKQFLSLCGEHLSLDNINCAIQRVAELNDYSLAEFCLIGDGENLYHHWYIGVNNEKTLDANELIHEIDQELKNNNDDYASVRKYILKDPKITLLPESTFYAFMESIGKAGSQNKFPRVLNAQQAEKWKAFIGQ